MKVFVVKYCNWKWTTMYDKWRTFALKSYQMDKSSVSVFSNIYLNTYITIPKYTNDSLCRSNNEQKKSTFNFYFRNIVIHLWEKIRHLTYEQTKYLFNFYYITTKMVVFSTYFTDHSTVNYCFWASNKIF